jgi:hypothetical protein
MGGKIMINKRIERLLVLRKDTIPNRYICQCDCGKIISVLQSNLYANRQKSCGCLKLEKTIQRSTTHNQRHTKLYEVWKTMKQRCLNPNNKSFHNYGGRGIVVCDEWKDNYQAFYEWSMNNKYKEGLSLDRINNDGNYEPSNCRWADRITQCNNTRQNKYYIINGVSKTIHQWSLEYNIPVKIVRQRLYQKWDLEKALVTPPRYLKSSK